MAEPIANRPLAEAEIGGEDADLLRIARERYRKAVDFDRDNREAALEDLEFLAGDQWPQEIRQERNQDERPILTINQLPKFVNQVTGDIRQNKPGIKVRPVDDAADDDTAEVFTGLIRNIETQSDAGTAYHTAAECAARGGIGHFRIVTEYTDDDVFEQDIRLRRMPSPFSVTWDPHATEVTRDDAEYCFVETQMDVETFKARYPDANLTGFDFDRSSTETISKWLGDWWTAESIRIAEYWTKRPEKRTLALMADGIVVDITDVDKDEEGVWRDGDGEPLDIQRTREVTRDKVEMRVIDGAEVLEGPFTFPGRHIPIIPVIGEEIHLGRNVVRYGVIRHAKDPQRAYNYWRTARTEHIALQPKAPFLVTADNIQGYKDIWDQANTRNLPYLPYVPDKTNQGAAPQRNAPPLGSTDMTNEIMLAAEDLKGSTGIYDAGLGAKSNETSGKAIRARQQESDTATFTYPDNLARALRHAGRILVEIIPLIYDTPRKVRLLNEDETAEKVVINQVIIDDDGNEKKINDLALGKYDVVVTTGPSFTTKRAEAVDGMMQLVQSAPDSAKLIMDILARNLDWPGADEIAERFRKTLPPGLAEARDGEDPPEPAPPTPEQQIEMAKEQRESAKTEAEIAETRADTRGKMLENMEREIALAMQTGQMQAVIEQQVMRIVMGMLAAAQPQPMAPQGEMIDGNQVSGPVVG